MIERERWQACMHFEPRDHVTDTEFSYWDETLVEWRKQGLPEYITTTDRADIFFGFETNAWAPVNPGGLEPEFESRVVEEDDRHQTVQDADGCLKIVNKVEFSTIPRYLSFPIETRADWDRFKKRLDPTSPARFDEDRWNKWKAEALASGKRRYISISSLFGRLRDWMGFQNIAYTIMDDPGLIQDMMEHMTNLCISVIERPLSEIRFDAGAMWEDMCFNHGSILQPKNFEKWMVPRLKRITELLNEHGCDIAFVDCDGNINELVPLWLDAGVNCMFPVEVRGGTDPIKLREKYGRRVLLMGGVDKTRLIAGKEEIRKEIARVKPLVEEGGYIPHVDHLCPPDVTLENYQYYLKVKRDEFGIPEPAPWEERREAYDWAR